MSHWRAAPRSAVAIRAGWSTLLRRMSQSDCCQDHVLETISHLCERRECSHGHRSRLIPRDGTGQGVALLGSSTKDTGVLASKSTMLRTNRWDTRAPSHLYCLLAIRYRGLASTVATSIEPLASQQSIDGSQATCSWPDGRRAVQQPIVDRACPASTSLCRFVQITSPPPPVPSAQRLLCIAATPSQHAHRHSRARQVADCTHSDLSTGAACSCVQPSAVCRPHHDMPTLRSSASLQRIPAVPPRLTHSSGGNACSS